MNFLIFLMPQDLMRTFLLHLDFLEDLTIFYYPTQSGNELSMRQIAKKFLPKTVSSSPPFSLMASFLEFGVFKKKKGL